MNYIDIFSEKIGNRHIGCNELLTPEKIEQLVQICSRNNIFYETLEVGSSEILYWVHNPTTEHCAQGMQTLTSESDTGLMDWFWFMYLPWDQFIELLSGEYTDKDQVFHDELLRAYDAPFRKQDQLNIEMNMNRLFDQGFYSVIQ
jgi:hypothetical protein